MDRLGTVSKVLQIKEHKKEEIELEMKKIREIINMEQARLNSLEKTYLDIIAAFNEMQAGEPLDVNEIGLFYNYLAQLYKKIEDHKIAIARELAELDLKQKAAVEAYKEKKLFEVMKEKIVKEDIKEKAVLEQKEMDSMFLFGRHRNK